MAQRIPTRSVHHLRRHRDGSPVMPTGPILSATGRARAAKLAIVEAMAPVVPIGPKLWDVTVVCKSHRRTLTVEGASKQIACAKAIGQYKLETRMPATTSVLVDECTRSTTTEGPDAA